MKQLFSTPKRAVISTVCIMLILLLVLGAGGALIYNRYSPHADGSSGTRASVSESAVPGGTKEVSQEDAKAAALSDAGLSAADVTFVKVGTDNDGAVRVYDIEFVTADMEYDYEIRMSDGTVYEKSMEPIALRPGASAAPAADQTGENQVSAAPAANQTGENQVSAAPAADQSGGNLITVDQAKEIALSQAGFREADVQFVKSELDYDHGRAEYEVEFYCQGNEYSCTVDAASGKVLDYEIDRD